MSQRSSWLHALLILVLLAGGLSPLPAMGATPSQGAEPAAADHCPDHPPPPDRQPADTGHCPEGACECICLHHPGPLAAVPPLTTPPPAGRPEAPPPPSPATPVAPPPYRPPIA